MAGSTQRVRQERTGCFYFFEDLWLKAKAWVRRRRNSYKLYLFFHFQGWMCLGGFVFALVMYYTSWSALNGNLADCTTTWQTTYDSQLQEQTVAGRQSLVCTDESNQAIACEISDMRLLLNGILISGVAMFLQAALSFNIAYAYNKFANLPQELLQHGKSSRMVALFGLLCKKGPWFCKILHIFQGLTVAVLVLFMVLGMCSMDLSRTYNCANYQADCEYIKLRNCRYYYGFCSVDETSAQNCYSIEGRKAFSGRVDIRLVHFSSCIRCALLAADVANTANYDEFWLLNESDKGTSTWQCSSAASSCFGSINTFTNIVCNCQTEATDIDFTAITCARRMPEGGVVIESGESSQWNSTDTEPGILDSMIQEEALLEGDEDVVVSRRLDAECVDNGETNLCAQGCSSGPGSPEGYFFDSQDCTAASSNFLFRQFVLYVYVIAVVWCNLTFVGQTIRIALRVEPYFLNPRPPRENIIWKLIRLAGPPKE